MVRMSGCNFFRRRRLLHRLPPLTQACRVATVWARETLLPPSSSGPLCPPELCAPHPPGFSAQRCGGHRERSKGTAILSVSRFPVMSGQEPKVDSRPEEFCPPPRLFQPLSASWTFWRAVSSRHGGKDRRVFTGYSVSIGSHFQQKVVSTGGQRLASFACSRSKSRHCMSGVKTSRRPCNRAAEKSSAEWWGRRAIFFPSTGSRLRAEM